MHQSRDTYSNEKFHEDVNYWRNYSDVSPESIQSQAFDQHAVGRHEAFVFDALEQLSKV